MDFRFQIASDVIRDGLGIELVDANGQVCAEVLRCDAAPWLFSFGRDVCQSPPSPSAPIT
ncbi:hypothetical protein CXB36_02605 [Pseudomonas syringae pv. syringae]|nr:hypothetical protein BKC06_019695 [Pseudomonas syringae pv. syringae]POP68673.1 hypothetical protein CXB36_02605 [Pseudomonas syringae pv. syringae]